MDEIEAALNEMILKLKSLCPVLIPSIFPSNRIVESINQLFANNLYIEKAKKWIDNNSKEPCIVFITELHYNTREIKISKIKCVSKIDETLYSVEKIMKLLVLGNEQELNVLMIRFLQINGYDGNISEERHIFHDAYNLAYAIKVICSNIPELRVTFDDMIVPINENISVNDILKKYCMLDDKSYSDDDDDDDESGNDDSNNDNGNINNTMDNKSSKKKRNRKRSKN